LRIDSRSVAVTGGGGFIGSHLVDSLIARDCQVTVLDSFDRGSLSNLKQNEEKLTVKNVDLITANHLEREIEGIDVLFDLAAKSPGNRDLYRNAADLLCTNIAITLKVARAASSEAVARVVFASSSCVYDRPNVAIPNKETDLGIPLSYYGWSKLIGEEIYAAHGEQFGLNGCAARVFNAYGPRESLRSPHVIPDFILKAFECKAGNRHFEILGDGKQTRSFLFVSDVVEGLIKLAESSSREAMNFGSTREITINELASLILRELNVDESSVNFMHHPSDPRDVRRRAPDISKAQANLGWEPKTDLEEGLHLTTDWWRENRATRSRG